VRACPSWARRAMAVLASLICGFGGLVGTAGSAVAAGTSVSGGGSTFAAPEIQQWTADVANPPSDLSVNYAVTSSAQGRDAYAQGQLQYGASDIVYYSNDGNYLQTAQSQHPFNYVTVSAGGLAFMYNIVIGGQRWRGLNLTGQEACQIFTGQLTNWSQLASTPGDAVLAGVNQPILPAVRSDGAGESYVFSQYCIAVDPTDWNTFQSYVDGPGAGLEADLSWPGDTDMSASPAAPVEFWPPALEGGVHALTANGAPEEVNVITGPTGTYSIGYMAAAYAVTAGFPVASVQNAAGQFVQPNATSVQIALSYAHLNSQGTFNLDFTGPSPQAYFPSTYSYILAPTTSNAPASAGADATLAQFLCYSVGAGQNRASPLLYAPLSQQVTTLAVNAIEGMPGAPPASQCGIGGPEPTVTPTGGGGAVVVTPTTVAPTTTAPSSATTEPPAATGPGATATTVAPRTGNSAGPTSVGTGGVSTTLPGAAASAGPTTTVPCSSVTTTAIGTTTIGAVTTTNNDATTTTPTSAATTSAAGATTTTLCANTSTTVAPAATTTTLSAGAVALGQQGSEASTTLVAGSPISVPLVDAPASDNTTNSEAYLYLLLGAVVCAVGVGAAGVRRRTTG
jgi:ABC-type phosphate transport system substrate-binding protein